MVFFRKEIQEVFTPRNEDINESMYVSRPELEKLLLRSLKRQIHTLVFGESGNGKSWLYKKVLTKENIPFVSANCANASRLGSITTEISSVIIGAGNAKNTKYQEETKAKGGVVVAQAEISHRKEYEVSQDEPLLNAFKIFNQKYSGKKIVVIDNLESIFQSDKLMSELADIIILLDDPRYAKYNVNFLIVGVPNGVLEYFSKTKNMESVSNRIEELEKVAGLDIGQVTEIVTRGFSQLKISFSEQQLKYITKHVCYVTLRIAQRVHEYCEALAYEIQENNWVFQNTQMERADLYWLKQGLRQSYQVIESHLNSRETTVARRNQVIWIIGTLNRHQFDSSFIDEKIKTNFPETIPVTNMGIGSILNDLSKGDCPILRKNEKTNEYSVVDPRYTMCIRTMLIKDNLSGKITKRNFNNK